MAFESKSVTTTSGVILFARSSRSTYSVLNPPGSGQTVYIQEGAPATANAASWALAAGDSFTGSYKGEVHAIASGSVSVTVGDH